jgi:hypothetical protein
MSQTLINLLSNISKDLWPSLPDERYILGCKLVLTCGACPEQYDVFFEEQEIGYLRLRHGRFYAEYVPTEEIVYVDHPKGDGIFDDDEREEELTKAVKAIVAKHTEIPEQIIVYLLNIETLETIGVYSTQELAEAAANKVKKACISIKEMVLDAEPKGENQ